MLIMQLCLWFAYISFFFSPDNEIEDTDNDSDDNKGCVCVILWTCLINLYSTILAATTAMTREAKQFNGFELQPGMGIFARSAGTRLGPTLMGRILPGPIRNRVGYGFFFKNQKRVQVGSGFYQKIRNPT